jgi:hypothetical protein
MVYNESFVTPLKNIVICNELVGDCIFTCFLVFSMEVCYGIFGCKQCLRLKVYYYFCCVFYFFGGSNLIFALLNVFSL